MTVERTFDIVGLGLATVDILTAVPHLPGPDDVFEVQALELQGGGPVATALIAAARLGSLCAMIGTTDTGAWGDLIVREFAADGVDTVHLERRRPGVASRSVILVEGAEGRRSILYSKGTVGTVEPASLPREAIQRAKVLHLDGSHLEAAVAAAEIARDAGALVSLDGGAGELWPGIDRLLPLVDVMVVAHRFAENVTGVRDPDRASDALRDLGAGQVVITDGPAGAWYLEGDERGHVPAFEVQAVDTTGAGDSFHGAYLYAVLEGMPIAERVRFASAVAAEVCLQLGGRTGLATRAEVDAFLRARTSA